MEYILAVLNSVFWFAIIIGFVVFIHEYGHYIIAKLCGVKIETFSIGFGKELFGYTDKSGTRWKVGILPLGGFIKMFGDADPASNPDFKKLDNMTSLEKKISFHYKSLKQKSLIVFAGPAANYLSAIIIMTALFAFYGKLTTLPEITGVSKDSPASKADIREGDIVLEVNENAIETFEEVRQIITLSNEEKITLKILRNNQEYEIELAPEFKKTKDPFGNEVTRPIIGISANKVTLKALSLPSALGEAVNECMNISINILKSVGQILTGQRGTDQLGGPIKIAQYSGQAAQHGLPSILWFIALISINLGLFNLFPIPILDGGHLMYYLIESIKGKPLAKKFQDYGLRIGFTFLMFLMIFAVFNDIKSFFH